MGLDVYLKHCPDFGDVLRRETVYEKGSEDLIQDLFRGAPYEQWDSVKKKDLEKRQKAMRKHLNLGKYGSAEEIEGIELPSVKYPDHLFKIGYFRSSYNGGGFNSVMEKAGLVGLDTILIGSDEEQESYLRTIDWRRALGNAQEALAILRQHIETPAAKLGCFAMDSNTIREDSVVDNEHDAIKKVLEAQGNKNDHVFDSYSNALGKFFLGGMKVLALLRGTKAYFGKRIFVVYEKDKSDWEFYVQALEIVIETIEYVLNSEDPQNYRLAWSG